MLSFGPCCAAHSQASVEDWLEFAENMNKEKKDSYVCSFFHKLS